MECLASIHDQNFTLPHSIQLHITGTLDGPQETRRTPAGYTVAECCSDHLRIQESLPSGCWHGCDSPEAVKHILNRTNSCGSLQGTGFTKQPPSSTQDSLQSTLKASGRIKDDDNKHQHTQPTNPDQIHEAIACVKTQLNSKIPKKRHTPVPKIPTKSTLYPQMLDPLTNNLTCMQLKEER
ncbi:hypothetical protein Pelo_17722 [Pelomyxa schiedti]|nr:hypothetical protein Pelo_17722 [Pelomyxa schiedti]